MLLEGQGATVMALASAEEALQFVTAKQPDVVISDVGMPHIDGYEFVRKMREFDSLRQTPTIALTAFARLEDKQKALAAGFQMHLTKPIQPSELIVAVANIMGRGFRTSNQLASPDTI